MDTVLELDAYSDSELEEMVAYGRKTTGVSHTIFFSPRAGAKHGPRVKVAIDPPDSIGPFGETASVGLDGMVVGRIDARLLREVLTFIELNRETLLAYWNYQILTDEFQVRLKRVE
jgi:hypothetical protein